MCFILRLAPCFVATARAVLLSALACIRNDSPISFSMACAKINSADNAPRAYISDSPLDKATVLSSTFTRQEKLINVTQCARCGFLRHWITSPVSVRISRDVFQCLVQFIWFQCRYRQVEIQFSCSFQISQHFLGTWSNLQALVTQVCMTSVLSRTSNPSRRADSNSSVPSKASSLPLRSAFEQCPSIRPRTWR